MRSLAPRLVACALLGAGAAQAEPFTLDHLLAQQSLGVVSIDPTQRWLVAPVTAPYRTAQRWDLGDRTRMTITQLRVFDLRQGGPPKLYPAHVGGLEAWGYSPGPYSPSGDKMAITRAKGRFLEVGILTLSTGAVVWTGLYPVNDFLAPAMRWRSDTTLIVLAKAPGTPTEPNSWQVEARQTDRWAATAAGRTSVTVLGSGRYSDLTPPPAPARLVLVDAATGRGRTLAEGPFLDLEIAPGGAEAAVLAKGPLIPLDPAVPLVTTDPGLRFRLQIIDLADGKVWSPCPDGDVSPDLLAWSPSGRDLLVYARQDGEPWSAGRYWRLNTAARQAAPLTDLAVTPATDARVFGRIIPRADWMGQTPLTLGRAADRPGSPPDWFAWKPAGPVNLTAGLAPTARNLVAVDGDGIIITQAERLYSIDATGHALLLGEGAPAPGAAYLDGERLRFNQRPAAKDLAMTLPAGPATRAAALLREEPREIGVETPLGEAVVLVAGKARAVASLRRDAHGVETLVLRQAGQAPRPLATLNAGLAAVDFATPKAIVHTGPKGQPLKSWLYLPPKAAPGARLPLLIIPYAGRDYPAPPASQAPPATSLFLNVQLMTAAGYAVLLPSLPVDPDREPAQGLADQILTAVDAAGATEPALDTKRLALWGHSYGGWTVLTAATQSPRFKAVIASAFAADLVRHYTRASLWSMLVLEEGQAVVEAAGHSERGQGRMGVPPWVDPDRYVRNSPYFAADKITAPVMLVMGDLDSDPTQSMAMFGALLRQNKDAISLTYHGEGHVYQTPANIADQHRRVLEFLRDALSPAGS